MPHVALLLVWLLLTGLCGLAAEVVLGRRMQLHLGSSGASQAVALATFLGGLALGAALAARVQRGKLATMPRPLLAWVGLEAFIGVWLLALPWLADAVFAGFELLAQSVPAGSAGLQIAKLGVAALLAMPLTTAMGATLPVLAVAVQRSTQMGPGLDQDHDITSKAAVSLLSRLYAVNALGAAGGAALAGYALLPALGLDAPLLVAGCIDLLVALTAGLVALRLPPVPPLEPPATTQTAATLAAGRVSPLLLAIAGLTGLSALVGEVLWTRLSALSMGASAYAFSLMLVVAVSGVALGSGLAMRVQATLGRPLELLLVTQLLAAVGSLWLAFRQDGLAVDLYALRSLLEPSRDAWPLWLTMSTVFVGLHLVPLAMALGAAFPLLLAAARQEGADPDRAAARLLAVNTAGNLVGALGGGFVVLPWLGLTGALVLAAAISLCGALLAAPTVRLRGVVAAVGVGLGLLTAVAQPSGDLLARGLFRTRPSSLADYAKQVEALRELTTLFRHDGKDGTVSVDRYKDGELVFRVSGKPDGGTRDTVTQAMLGHLGMLLRPGAKEALLIGLGTGQTAAALASHAGVAVHVVELSRAMPDIARLFGQLNDNVLDHPRVRVTLADAREVLRQIPPHSLDLVVSEPSNPWVVGVADLYTLQSFARIRERLRPGGLLVQWMQRYEIGDENLTRILCTMHGALPNMVVFRMEPFDLALIGSAEPIVWDQAAVERLLAQETVQANLARGGNKAMPRAALHFAAAQIAGPQTVAQLCDGFDNWLLERQPQLEYDAPADFYARRQSERLLRRLDTRRSSTPDTWLAQRLSKQPLTDTDKADLFQFYVESRSPEEFPLAAALAGPDDMPVNVRAVTDHLPDPEAPSEAGKHAAWCAWIRQQLPWLLSEFTTQYGPVSRAPNTAAWAKRCTQPAKPR
jgi:spermidine synthase